MSFDPAGESIFHTPSFSNASRKAGRVFAAFTCAGVKPSSGCSSYSISLWSAAVRSRSPGSVSLCPKQRSRLALTGPKTLGRDREEPGGNGRPEGNGCLSAGDGSLGKRRPEQRSGGDTQRHLRLICFVDQLEVHGAATCRLHSEILVAEILIRDRATPSGPVLPICMNQQPLPSVIQQYMPMVWQQIHGACSRQDRSVLSPRGPIDGHGLP